MKKTIKDLMTKKKEGEYCIPFKSMAILHVKNTNNIFFVFSIHAEVMNSKNVKVNEKNLKFIVNSEGKIFPSRYQNFTLDDIESLVINDKKTKVIVSIPEEHFLFNVVWAEDDESVDSDSFNHYFLCLYSTEYLKKQMWKMAEKEEYEIAAKIRDEIKERENRK